MKMKSWQGWAAVLGCIIGLGGCDDVKRAKGQSERTPEVDPPGVGAPHNSAPTEMPGRQATVDGGTATPARVAAPKRVSIGPFGFAVPADWRDYSAAEAATLRSQYLEQSRQIYAQFSGDTGDPADSVEIAGYHLNAEGGTFAAVSFTVPPQADLIGLLKSQVDEKMEWGVQEGHIRKYLGRVPVDQEGFSGFYTKAIGRRGNIEISGGLEHRDHKNRVVQLTLLCPGDWQESKATAVLEAILKSLNIGEQAPQR